MFELKVKIENVRSFALDGDYLYLNLTSKEIIEYYSSKTLVSDVWLTDFRIYENSIFINGINPESFHIQEMNVLQFDFSLLYLDKDILIGIIDEKEETRTIIQNYNTKEFYGEIDTFSMIFLRANELFFRSNSDRTKIELYSFPDTKLLWEYDLIELGTYKPYTNEEFYYKVNGFMGIIGDEIFIDCSGYIILALNIHTGKHTRRWQSFDDRNAVKLPHVMNISHNVLARYFFSKDKKHLIAFGSKSIFRIDLETNEFTEKDLSASLDKHKIRYIEGNSKTIETESHYFILVRVDGDKMGLDEDYGGFIAINKETYEIDWLHWAKGFYVKWDYVELVNDKLYILSGKELLIFEKTSKRNYRI